MRVNNNVSARMREILDVSDKKRLEAPRHKLATPGISVAFSSQQRRNIVMDSRHKGVDKLKAF